MDALLATVLSNAIITTALALLVFGVGLRMRRPALLHGLWLLVLLKLVTPPVFTIAWEPSAPAAPVAQPTLRPTIPSEAPAKVMPVSPPLRASTPIPWKQMLLMLWIGGSAAWMLLVAVRLHRFRKLLKEVKPVPEWVAEETRTLAGRIGLSRIPPVSLLPGAISPMIFAFGSAARVLLPQELWTSLSREEARSLLAHELAHLRRRDHWIRILELVVTGIYWWLPTLWWARRELRKAEEECCDAWVVWALPDQEEVYAEALVRVVGRSPLALPPAASGIGHFSDLKRRISMVMEGRTPHRISAGARSMLLGLALLVPLIPVWAQEKQPESKEAARREERAKSLWALQERVALHRATWEKLPADSPLRREKLIALRHAELDLEVAREDLQATPQAAKELTGKVTAADAKMGVVVITIGQDQGGVEGQKLAVYRDGRFVAALAIERTDRMWSAGKVLYKSADPRVGDDVSSVIEHAGHLPRPLVGKIALSDAGHGKLALDLRESDGARAGMRFEVRRLAQKIGTIVITDLQPWGSWAKPEGDLKIDQVQKGDLVEAVGETSAAPAPGQDGVDLLKVRVEIQLARLREAELAAKHSARRLELTRVLVEKGLAPQSELLERQKEADLGQSQVTIRRAELKEAEMLLSQAESRLRKTR